MRGTGNASSVHDCKDIFREESLIQIYHQEMEVAPSHKLLALLIQWHVCLWERCRKKGKKKLTSVSFAFTHTHTLEKLTLLLCSSKRTWKIFSWYLTRKLVSFYVRRQHQSIAVWWKGSTKSLRGQCAESFRQAHFCKSTGKRRALFWAKLRTRF